MYLRHHFLSCIILSLILYPLFDYYSLLVFIFGFFIDLDHYFYSVFKFKKINIFSSYKMHMNKGIIAKDQLHIFHTIEFMIIFILSIIFYRNIYILLLGIGLVLHWILDEIYLIYMIYKKEELKQTRARSVIFWLKRNLFN